MSTPILALIRGYTLMFILCMYYTFSSTKSYDMHSGVHDWLVNSGEMVIYAFLLEFFSSYN